MAGTISETVCLVCGHSGLRPHLEVLQRCPACGFVTARLDAPIDGQKPDPDSFKALDMIAILVGLSIETWKQIDDREARLAKIEGDRSRLQQAAGQATAQVPLFLRHELEKTI